MNRYKQCRQSRGMSQKFVALSVGVSAPMVSQWEAGTKEPSKETLVKLADLFNVTTDYLLCREERTKEKQPTVSDDGLKDAIISQIRELPDPALTRVADFLQGLQAGQEVAAAAAAAPDPDDGPAQ